MDDMLTESDLERIRVLIYEKTGIYFEVRKDYYLKTRLMQRIETLKCSTFKEYYCLLLSSPQDVELSCLIEELTINETYFFRDFPQLQGFAESVLPPYLDKKRADRDYSLKIWSAACSTGEEPYTLSIILREMIDDFGNWQVRVLATDIDRKVLRHARLGLFGDRSMRDTPIPYRQRYFKEVADGSQILPDAADSVFFEQVNLIDKAAMRRKAGFDFIFCRNVLIYFDDDSRKRVLASLYDALSPGGYVFLGHAESVGRITASFVLERIGDFLCYKKPE